MCCQVQQSLSHTRVQCRNCIWMSLWGLKVSKNSDSPSSFPKLFFFFFFLLLKFWLTLILIDTAGVVSPSSPPALDPLQVPLWLWGGGGGAVIWCYHGNQDGDAAGAGGAVEADVSQRAAVVPHQEEDLHVQVWTSALGGQGAADGGQEISSSALAHQQIK